VARRYKQCFKVKKGQRWRSDGARTVRRPTFAKYAYVYERTRTCTNVRVRTSEKSRQIAVNAYIMIIYYSASRKQEDLVYLASCTVYYSLMHSNLGQNPQKVSF
jgi:hypothetical protein